MLKDRIFLAIAESRTNPDNPGKPGQVPDFEGLSDDEIYNIIFNKIVTAIKLEVSQDPASVGYAGLSFKEQLDLLLQPGQVIEKVFSNQPSRLDLLKEQVKFNDESSASIVALKNAIDDEIANDPVGLGYQGLTPDEQDVLLQERILGTFDSVTPGPPRWSVVSVGISFLPNDLTLGELMELFA